MAGSKLDDAKTSFASMIDTLEERDTLIVQPFSSQGTEKLWGPKPATDGNKAGAKEFVSALYTGGGTNLNDAFLDGIANVYEVAEEVAPILVILTDGQGNIGPKVTAQSVLRANEGRKVKIFSLAFGYDADMDLLCIAIQNGGRAARIYEGFGDAVTQMELFYQQELGTIMLSDIDVSYDFGHVSVIESTVSSFPVLAGGSELVIRGKVDSSLSLAEAAGRSLASTGIAKSNLGPQKWSNEFPIVLDDSMMISDCSSTFAQSRIMELLEYRDAERALGEDLFGTSQFRSSNSLLSFEEQARQIALDAGLVWPGLTALVTLENMSCQTSQYDVCSAAEGGAQDEEEDVAFQGEGAAMVNPKASPTSGASTGATGVASATFVFRSSLFILSVVLTAVLVY